MSPICSKNTIKHAQDYQTDQTVALCVT